MPAVPKPSKEIRERREQQRLKSLKEHRRNQAALAVYRDNGLCAICYFTYHRIRRMDDVHHVYGRGRLAVDWREQYNSLLCVCRECHPQPILQPGKGHALAWVEDILRQANAMPINPSFLLPETSV